MTGHIFIEGEIGLQVTAKSVRGDIENYPEATEFLVHINSPGGDVYEGYQIGSILQNLGKPTTAFIGSMCASIATYDALSCDKVIMNPHGDFMIHLPTANMSGTADDLRKGAEQLDRIKSELISKYAPKVARKGVTREQLSAMMEKETSMSPSEAFAMGFVDEVREKLKAVARIDTKKFNMEQGWFENIGKKLDAILKKMHKNVSVTLADGSVISSTSETAENLVGSTLTDEAGQPLPPGEVETADGQILKVANEGLCETSTPKSAKEPEKPVKPEEDEEMAALKAENEALKAKLAEASNTAEQAAKASDKAMAEFRNEVKELKASLETISKQTFGDTSVPGDANGKKEGKEVDPMIARMQESYFNAFKTSR